MAEKCYYLDYGMCTCTMSKNCDNACEGAEKCAQFISENEYFGKMMAGEIKENAPREDREARQKRINKNLAPGKTKKQLKYEAREREAKERERDEARGLTGGVSLMDDPRFKDLFKK